MEIEEDGLSGLDALGIALKRDEYTESLLSFVRDAWPILEPMVTFVENWHVVELCTLLEDLTFTMEEAQHSKQAAREFERIVRLIINIPPGTMKSLLVSVIFPCWLWARDSTKRVLTAAYSDKRALDANIKARNLIKSGWYQKLFGLTLVEDQNTKGRFDTTKGGWRIATSVGGEGTGLHPDLIIIDDASTATDAKSDIERKAVNDWFSSTVSSRGVSRNVAIIVIGQRLHQEDLPGYLITKDREGWTLVRWPMRFEMCTCPEDLSEKDEARRCVMHKADPQWRADPRDPRTQPGELLFPQLFDEAKVKKLELDLANDAPGQLQQRPAAEGGSLFKREWFKFVDAAPTVGNKMRAYDTAGTEKGGDYTVGVKMLQEYENKLIPAEGYARARFEMQPTGRVYVLNVVRDQLGPDGVDKLIKSTAEADGKTVPVREEREGGASGKAQIVSRTRLLAGFDYAEVSLGTNKQVRAKPFRAQVEAGNVFLVRGEWNEEYITELCNFPTGKHDDQVDASSCCYNSILLEPPPRKVEITW